MYIGGSCFTQVLDNFCGELSYSPKGLGIDLNAENSVSEIAPCSAIKEQSIRYPEFALRTKLKADFRV